jgi:hypothetical protein
MNVSLINDKELLEIKDSLKRIERALTLEKPKIGEYYDSSQVMQIMNWSRTTFQRWIKTVPFIKVRGRIMVKKEVLDNFAKEGKTNGQTH